MTDFIAENSYILSQICGFLAIITAFSMYQFKKHRTIMFLSVLCSGIWCLHFAFLGLINPILMNVVNLIRGAVYACREKPWANKKFIPYLFAAVSLTLTVVTWENAWGVLPCIGTICSTFANWQTDTRKLKLLTVPVSLSWGVYDAVNKSVAGCLNEVLVLISIALYFIRARKETI